MIQILHGKVYLLHPAETMYSEAVKFMHRLDTDFVILEDTLVNRIRILLDLV